MVLTSIDDKSAKKLAKSKCFVMSLGLTAVDKEVAKMLAQFEGKCLYLRSLKSIDKDVANELSKFKGEKLYLDEETSIDKSVLKILKSNPAILLF